MDGWMDRYVIKHSNMTENKKRSSRLWQNQTTYLQKEAQTRKNWQPFYIVPKHIQKWTKNEKLEAVKDKENAADFTNQL